MEGSSVPPALKRVAHAGSRTFGRMTAGQRMLPGLLIAGGQRCGTTSLYRALAQHPAIFKAVLHKGVHYFDTDYHRGLSWYRAHFPLQRSARSVEARTGIPPITFESSPYYMYHPLAMQRIATDLPEVKIVALVRDPVERAYSQHAHEVARGFEPVTDFAQALSLEDERLAGQDEKLAADPKYHNQSHQHHGYRARGQYVDYLERMEKLVGRERIHVLDSAEFFYNPEPVYDALLDFLGMPKRGYPTFEQRNARPRPSAMPDSARKDLTEHFRPYDDRLVAWLGWEPTWCRAS